MVITSMNLVLNTNKSWETYLGKDKAWQLRNELNNKVVMADVVDEIRWLCLNKGYFTGGNVRDYEEMFDLIRGKYINQAIFSIAIHSSIKAEQSSDNTSTTYLDLFEREKRVASDVLNALCECLGIKE